MSTIQVKSTNVQRHKNLGRYLYVSMESGKHALTVAVAPDHVQVIVENASNKAWRGLGKRFSSMAAALAAYKTPAIRAMLEHAVKLDEWAKKYEANTAAALTARKESAGVYL